MTENTVIVTMVRQRELVCHPSNGAISNDLEWPFVSWRNARWHEALRGLSATAELLAHFWPWSECWIDLAVTLATAHLFWKLYDDVFNLFSHLAKTKKQRKKETHTHQQKNNTLPAGKKGKIIMVLTKKLSYRSHIARQLRTQNNNTLRSPHQ